MCQQLANGSKAFFHVKPYVVSRAGLNEREIQGKVLTARPPKHLAQLRSVSHALVSTLQKHRSKTSELIENLKSAAKFRLINLIVAMTLHVPS